MSSNINAPVAYIKHDVGMRNHRKVRVLRQKFSHMGYAVWCYLLETLAGKEGFAVPFDEVEQEILAVDFGVDVQELRDVVEACVRLRLLTLKDGLLQSDTLIERLGNVLDSRQKMSEAGKLGAERRWGSNSNPIATLSDPNSNPNGDPIATLCQPHSNPIATLSDPNSNPNGDPMEKPLDPNGNPNGHPIEKSTDPNGNPIATLCDPNGTLMGSNSRVEKSRVEKSIDNSSSSSSACVHERERVCERVREAWDAALGGKLTKLKSLTRNRAELVESALGEIEPDVSKWGDLAAELFARVGESSFLLDKGKGWMPTFEWVFESSERVQQILEGQYAESYGPAQPKGVKRQALQARGSVPVYRDADHWSEEHRRGKTFDELTEREQDLLRQLNPGKYPPKEAAK